MSAKHSQLNYGALTSHVDPLENNPPRNLSHQGISALAKEAEEEKATHNFFFFLLSAK